MKTAILALFIAASLSAQAPPPTTEVAVLETSLGTMVFRLLETDAPKTVANFKALVKEGFYDGKPFYRVVAGHVIQTGDGGESGRPTVPDEFNANQHIPGALGLAHGSEPSAPALLTAMAIALPWMPAIGAWTRGSWVPRSCCSVVIRKVSCCVDARHCLAKPALISAAGSWPRRTAGRILRAAADAQHHPTPRAAGSSRADSGA